MDWFVFSAVAFALTSSFDTRVISVNVDDVTGTHNAPRENCFLCSLFKTPFLLLVHTTPFWNNRH